MFTTGIILLAGNSTRYKKEFNKNLDLLNFQYVFLYSLNLFLKCSRINNIILVVRECDKRIVTDIINKLPINKNIMIVLGGGSRKESVYNALVRTDSQIVVIQDAARPLIKESYITLGIEALNNYDGAITGVKAKDTIKIVNEKGEILSSTDRNNTYIGQTPQIFKRELLLSLYKKYLNDDNITDDAMLLEKENYRLKIIPGDYTNIKITTPEDLIIANEYLKKLK